MGTFIDRATDLPVVSAHQRRLPAVACARNQFCQSGQATAAGGPYPRTHALYRSRAEPERVSSPLAEAPQARAQGAPTLATDHVGKSLRFPPNRSQHLIRAAAPSSYQQTNRPIINPYPHCPNPAPVRLTRIDEP